MGRDTPDDEQETGKSDAKICTVHAMPAKRRQKAWVSQCIIQLYSVVKFSVCTITST